MKKQLLIFSVLIIFYQASIAQNVGIGTSAPTAKLHIKGSADTSQLMIDAAAAQMNTHPLIRLRNNSGNDLLWIHSDDTSNIFIGFNAGRVNDAANGAKNNLFIGSGTGYNNTEGSSNIGLGLNALYNNVSGVFNTGIGWHSLFSNSTGNYNTALGNAMEFNTTGAYNTGLGHGALYNNITADGNTAVGGFALFSNTYGTYNTALGASALKNNTTGHYNIAVGPLALFSNTTECCNTAIGYEALVFNTGRGNTAVGHQTLKKNTTGINNTAIGYKSLQSNTTASSNIGLGFMTLMNNSSGNNNIAIGPMAMGINQTGSQNTAVGGGALGNTSASDNNTVLGWQAGSSANMGWNNTLIGAESKSTVNDVFNSVALGYNVSITASNQVRIGNTSNNSVGGYANWTNISDGRFKKNIKEDVRGLDFIMQLRPVTYQLDITGLRKKLNEPDEYLKESKMDLAIAEKESMIQTGFVAQEVEAAAKKLGYDFSGVDKPKNENDLYGLRYAEFVVPLVKAVQEQQKMIETLQTKIALLEMKVKHGPETKLATLNH